MLVKRYGKKIRQRQDNLERYIDVVFWADGVDTSELRNKLQGVQLLDSGYILHMMQVGISKGNTVSRILGMIGYNRLTASEVMAIGDSTTDISLFQQIPESVLVLNPIISQDKKELLFRTAKYVTDHENGQGFTELCEHIIKARCR
jgi:hydroxymethylpyrimidine pyrophosphatase-like HAD family hydrolase